MAKRERDSSERRDFLSFLIFFLGCEAHSRERGKRKETDLRLCDGFNSKNCNLCTRKRSVSSFFFLFFSKQHEVVIVKSRFIFDRPMHLYTRTHTHSQTLHAHAHTRWLRVCVWNIYVCTYGSMCVSMRMYVCLCVCEYVWVYM